MASPLSARAAAFSVASSSSSTPAPTMTVMSAVTGPSTMDAGEPVTTAEGAIPQASLSASGSHGMMKAPHRAISPPTPAPSPQPDARRLARSDVELETRRNDQPASRGTIGRPHANSLASGISDDAAPLVKLLAREFPLLTVQDRQILLRQLIDLCSARELAALSSLISPRLKVDFLSALPIEVSLHIVSYLDDPRTLARASGVSRFWRSLVNDEHTWKIMCARYSFRQVPATAVDMGTSLSKLAASPATQYMQMSDGNVDLSSSSADAAIVRQISGTDAMEIAHGDVRSPHSLSSLYAAYRARGLDPATAFAELRAVHELFLSKRAREINQDDWTRQQQQQQQQGDSYTGTGNIELPNHPESSFMGEEDRQFYQQLEAFVREREAHAVTSRADPEADIGGAIADGTTSRDPSESAVGWLSSGPLSNSRLESNAIPSTPIGMSTVTAQHADDSPSVPVREAGRSLNANLVSPTSRLGTMTSGLLTSLWDRTGISSTANSAHSDTGDHRARVTIGHSEPQADRPVQMDDDEVMQVEDHDSRDLSLSSTISASEITTYPQDDLAPRNGDTSESRAKRRLRIDSQTDEGSSAPLKPALQSWPDERFAEGRRSLTAEVASLGESSKHSQSASKAKRVNSSAFERMRSSRASQTPSPFSYKTHFKLAYLTEQNWLRGGRLLTQHVSSMDVSPDGNIVTSLSIDDEWIVVGMANAKIHVFDARTGLFVKTLTGHSSGVWCLSLISASSPFGSQQSGGRSAKSQAKMRSRSGLHTMTRNEEMDEDLVHAPPSTLGAYPYDSDRPLYTPTPDLNLIHHDPRPSANVYAPDGSFLSNSSNRPSMPLPRSFSHDMDGTNLTPSASDTEDIHEHTHETRRSGMPQTESTGGPSSFRGGTYSSRGAGLGSNFGSPCGSVAGYGNEHAIVVSSGCDRDVRVWDVNTGECKYVLTGHRSTVRCLRVFDGRPIAITGSRDGTMRVWNVETGQQVHLLAGHQHSVRCLDLAGNLVASASYDCTGRIWNVDTGKCVHVLRGHFHQLYAIAFDGVHVATGSLDTTVRVWSAETGECLALLQAHTSLVGQLQLTDSTLITGGSDGKVVVFSLKTMKIMYQLLAHGNSVTCLQFDDRFIVTGGNDGKVKLWNFRTGEFVRELCEASDQVWKVSFRDDKCVVLCKRNVKTAIDVISFRPIEEAA